MRFLVVGLVAATVFGCAKSDDNNSNGADKQVTVKIKTTAVGTRAGDKTTVPFGAVSTVNDVTVFFLDGNDRVVSSQGTMTPSEITTGKTFTGVNPATTKVYIVANTNNAGSPLFPGLASIGINQTKADIEALSAIAGTQMGASAMGIDNVVLSGEAALTAINATDYTAHVPVTPAVCRFEVTSITGINDITAFDLEGIYLNTYYPQFTIGGGSAGTYYGLSVAEADLVNVAAYMKDTALAMTGSLSYKHADPTKVWAYAVPAGNTSPRIILRLDNVAIGGIGSLPSTQYITVKNFTDHLTGDPVIIKRGEVYVVRDIQFEGDDLTDLPNQDDINVTVTVEVKGWKVFLVDPQI